MASASPHADILGMEADYCTVPEDRIVQMMLLVGWSYETESADAQNAARGILQGWIQNGLPYVTASNGERLFDPVEVANFPKREGATPSDIAYLDQLTDINRQLVLDLAGSDVAKEKRFVVDFTRTFNLRDIAAGSKLRLRMPLPLAGDYLTDLVVKPYAETVGESRIKISSGRLEACTTAAGDAEAILGATMSFTAHLQEPLPNLGVTLPDQNLYLSADEGLIVVTDRIRALAKTLAGTNASSLESVRAFWDYIKTELTNGALHYDQINRESPCDWVLDKGWFDCQMGATLLVALCRAKGIPARILGGFLLHHEAPTRHYWSEVWIDGQGWTPFDFLGLDRSNDGDNREWHDRFFGRLEYRMTCERLPHEFTGAIGVPFPPSWSLVQVPKAGGSELQFLRADGAPVYVDTIRVRS